MKPLPIQFKRGEYTYTQLDRSDSGWCIYRQEKQSTGEQWFEVIKVQERKAFTIKGITYEDAEVYPNDEDWGTLGFTCRTKGRAYELVEQLVKRAPVVVSDPKGGAKDASLVSHGQR